MNCATALCTPIRHTNEIRKGLVHHMRSMKDPFGRRHRYPLHLAISVNDIFAFRRGERKSTGPFWGHGETGSVSNGANPLADARGSDRSPDREGGVAFNGQHSPGREPSDATARRYSFVAQLGELRPGWHPARR